MNILSSISDIRKPVRGEYITIPNLKIVKPNITHNRIM